MIRSCKFPASDRYCLRFEISAIALSMTAEESNFMQKICLSPCLNFDACCICLNNSKPASVLGPCQRIRICEELVDHGGLSQQSLRTTTPKYHKHYKLPGKCNYSLLFAQIMNIFYELIDATCSIGIYCLFHAEQVVLLVLVMFQLLQEILSLAIMMKLSTFFFLWSVGKPMPGYRSHAEPNNDERERTQDNNKQLEFQLGNLR